MTNYQKFTALVDKYPADLLIQCDGGRLWNACAGVAGRPNRGEPSMTPTEFVGQLESGVTAKFKTWDLYRAALGGWRFVGAVDSQRCEISACGIVEALTRAITWQPLPVVPRPVKWVYRADCGLRKEGRRWIVQYHGSPVGSPWIARKQDAERWADAWVESTNRRAAQWRAEYGWTEGKTEGVDFRWEL